MLSSVVLLAADAPSGYNFILPIGLLLIFYFLLYRPMKRQEADRQALQNLLSKNDEVLTHAGIYGTIVSISETKNEIVVRVDDSVRLKMVKESIARNFTKEQAAEKQSELITKE